VHRTRRDEQRSPTHVLGESPNPLGPLPSGDPLRRTRATPMARRARRSVVGLTRCRRNSRPSSRPDGQSHLVRPRAFDASWQRPGVSAGFTWFRTGPGLGEQKIRFPRSSRRHWRSSLYSSRRASSQFNTTWPLWIDFQGQPRSIRRQRTFVEDSDCDAADAICDIESIAVTVTRGPAVGVLLFSWLRPRRSRLR
jgi:hypothetical protein